MLTHQHVISKHGHQGERATDNMFVLRTRVGMSARVFGCASRLDAVVRGCAWVYGASAAVQILGAVSACFRLEIPSWKYFLQRSRAHP